MTAASGNTGFPMLITASVAGTRHLADNRSQVCLCQAHGARAFLALASRLIRRATTSGRASSGSRGRTTRAAGRSPSTRPRPAPPQCRMPGTAGTRHRSRPRRPPARDPRARGESASRRGATRRAWAGRPPRRGGASGSLNPFRSFRLRPARPQQADSRRVRGCPHRDSGLAALSSRRSSRPSPGSPVHPRGSPLLR
jgi:hypothetical protein